jgi:hypothetical protein
VTAAALDRDAERTADRLRVVGPRMAARTGEDAAAVLGAVHAALQRLADLAADAEGRPHRPVPALGAHGLGDQVLVLAHDVSVAGAADAVEAARTVLAELRARI